MLRVIGDPETRYREDPVRMLRAVRLAAKLGLTLEAQTREPIRRLAPLMERVPPARLFRRDAQAPAVRARERLPAAAARRGPAQGLLPLLDVILEQPLGERFVTLALAQTDERVLAERPVSPAFLFAALLWHEVLAAWKARQARRAAAARARGAMDEVLDTQCAKLAITRKLTATMREVWAMQPRFEQRSGSARSACSKRRAFAWPTISSRCAPRAASGGELEEWWRAFQSATPSRARRCCCPSSGAASAGGRGARKGPRGGARRPRRRDRGVHRPGSQPGRASASARCSRPSGTRRHPAYSRVRTSSL
jgi:poly(A) polymerase